MIIAQGLCREMCKEETIVAFEVRGPREKTNSWRMDVKINTSWVPNAFNKKPNFKIYIFNWKSEGGSTAYWIDPDDSSKETCRENKPFCRLWATARSLSLKMKWFSVKCTPKMSECLCGLGILTQLWMAFPSRMQWGLLELGVGLWPLSDLWPNFFPWELKSKIPQWGWSAELQHQSPLDIFQKH